MLQLELVQIVYITGTILWAVIQCYVFLDSNFYAICIEKFFTKLKNTIMQEDTKKWGAGGGGGRGCIEVHSKRSKGMFFSNSFERNNGIGNEVRLL